MKNIVSEILISLLDLFNNPISIIAASIAVIVCVLLCRYKNYKVNIFVICGSIFMIAFGLWICILNNTPDYLWIPLFFAPFFITYVAVLIAYYAVKFVLFKMKNISKK